MKLLFVLLILVGCGKPANPINSSNPVYGSVTAVISGVETSCENCLIMETSGKSIRVTFSDNGIEECSGEGSLGYLSNSSFASPGAISEMTEWDGIVVGDNASKSPFCFPDQVSIEMKKTAEDMFEFNYNGKFFNIKRLN